MLKFFVHIHSMETMAHVTGAMENAETDTSRPGTAPACAILKKLSS
jgi:hypothetical protein